MSIPSWHPLRPSVEHDHSGNQVQVYRLSDLSLIKTIRLPANEGPNEPRVLRDGRTVLVNTVACRLYQVTGLEGSDPQLRMVHREPQRGCAMPVVIGDYWVQAHAADHRVFSLDVHDLDHVRAASSVSFDERQRPHWLATDGSRIVVVNEPVAAAERRMWMLSIDRATGELALDRAFRDADSDRPRACLRPRGLAARRHRNRHAARHRVRLVASRALHCRGGRIRSDVIVDGHHRLSSPVTPWPDSCVPLSAPVWRPRRDRPKPAR